MHIREYGNYFRLSEDLKRGIEIEMGFPVAYPLVHKGQGSSADVFEDANGLIFRISEDRADHDFNQMARVSDFLPEIHHSEEFNWGSLTVRDDYPSLEGVDGFQTIYFSSKEIKIKELFPEFFSKYKIRVSDMFNSGVTFAEMLTRIYEATYPVEHINGMMNDLLELSERHHQGENSEMLRKQWFEVVDAVFTSSIDGDLIKMHPGSVDVDNGVFKKLHTYSSVVFVMRSIWLFYMCTESEHHQSYRGLIRDSIKFQEAMGVNPTDMGTRNLGVRTNGNELQIVFRDFYHTVTVDKKIKIDMYRRKQGLSEIWGEQFYTEINIPSYLMATRKMAEFIPEIDVSGNIQKFDNLFSFYDVQNVLIVDENEKPVFDKIIAADLPGYQVPTFIDSGDYAEWLPKIVRDLGIPDEEKYLLTPMKCHIYRTTNMRCDWREQNNDFFFFLHSLGDFFSSVQNEQFTIDEILERKQKFIHMMDTMLDELRPCYHEWKEQKVDGWGGFDLHKAAHEVLNGIKNGENMLGLDLRTLRTLDWNIIPKDLDSDFVWTVLCVLDNEYADQLWTEMKIFSDEIGLFPQYLAGTSFDILDGEVCYNSVLLSKAPHLVEYMKTYQPEWRQNNEQCLRL